MNAPLSIQCSVGFQGQNMPADVKVVQQLINRKQRPGQPLLKIDGIAGPRTIQAIINYQRTILGFANPDGLVSPNGPTAASLKSAPAAVPQVPAPSQAPVAPPAPTSEPDKIAWGAKVSPAFKTKVIQICKDLDMPPDYLMAAMAFESGLRPDAVNKYTGATGLIQFMPKTAKALGTTTDDLKKMTAEKQLDYVKAYFKSHKGKVKTIEDLYMTILWPAAVGKANDTSLFNNQKDSKTKTAYEQNKSLDKDGDGIVTKAEAAAHVRSRYEKGLLPGNFG